MSSEHTESDYDAMLADLREPLSDPLPQPQPPLPTPPVPTQQQLQRARNRQHQLDHQARKRGFDDRVELEVALEGGMCPMCGEELMVEEATWGTDADYAIVLCLRCSRIVSTIRQAGLWDAIGRYQIWAEEHKRRREAGERYC